MRDKDLYKKRIYPALDEMYRRSSDAFGYSAFENGISWEDLQKYSDVLMNKSKPTKIIPYYAFYLDEEIQKDILDKYTKNLRSVWVWRDEVFENDDEGNFNYVKYKKELEELDKKSLSLKDKNKEIDRISKSYGMVKRSYDRDKIIFNVFNLSPSNDKNGFEILRSVYDWWRKEGFSEAIHDFKEKLHITDRILEQVMNMRVFECNYIKSNKKKNEK